MYVYSIGEILRCAKAKKTVRVTNFKITSYRGICCNIFLSRSELRRSWIHRVHVFFFISGGKRCMSAKVAISQLESCDKWTKKMSVLYVHVQPTPILLDQNSGSSAPPKSSLLWMKTIRCARDHGSEKRSNCDNCTFGKCPINASCKKLMPIRRSYLLFGCIP